MKVAIVPDFRDLFPPLTPEEYEQLKANNLDDPNHERVPPVVIWQCEKKWVIIEGHHTYKARSNMRVDGKPAKIRYHKMDFADRESAKAYARRAQLGRRNLSPSQVAMILAQEPKVPEGASLAPSGKLLEKADLPPSRERLAKDYGMSERTVRYADKVTEHGAKAVQKAVIAGDVSVSDAAAIVDLPKREQTTALWKVRQGETKTLKAAVTLNDRPKRKHKTEKKLDRKAYYRQWDQAIGPLVRLVDKIGHGVDEHNGAKQKRVEKALREATDAMMDWMGVGK